MRDEELFAELLACEPRQAPASMDAAILERAGSLARKRRRDRALRRGAWLASLAAVLVLGIAFFALTSLGSGEARIEREALVTETRERALEDEFDARLLLLEIKLSRLKRLADVSEGGASCLAELEEIERQLDELREPSEKPAEDSEKRSWIPGDEKETRHA